MPGHTLKGMRAVGTWVGFTCTFIAFCLTITFAVFKLDILINHKYPTIGVKEVTKEGYDITGIDIKNSLNFTIAMRVIDGEGQVRHDPDYVNWDAIFIKSNGLKELKLEEVRMHPCSSDEIKQFHPPTESTKDKIFRF